MFLKATNRLCSVSNMLRLAAALTPPLSPAGAVPAAHGRQTPHRAFGADLLQDQQCVISVQRRRSGRQPLGPEQRLVLERGARPLAHGHLHRSHDTGEKNTSIPS